MKVNLGVWLAKSDGKRVAYGSFRGILTQSPGRCFCSQLSRAALRLCLTWEASEAHRGEGLSQSHSEEQLSSDLVSWAAISGRYAIRGKLPTRAPLWGAHWPLPASCCGCSQTPPPLPPQHLMG